jgi:RHS repeat-associated protein
VNPLGQVTTTLYDDIGQNIATVNARGYRTTYAYDAAGRRTAVWNPRGFRTTTVYDAAGRTVATVNPLGYTATTVYDAAGRAIAAVNPYGSVSTTLYDAAGRSVATVSTLGQRVTSVYDPASRLIATINGRGFAVTNVYDAAGRQTAQLDALGRATTYGYDPAGRQTLRWSPRDIRQTLVYDAAGQHTEDRYPSGLRYTYTYDLAGRRTAFADAGGTTASLYSPRGEVTAVVQPGGKRLSYTYDPARRRSLMEGPSGRTTYTYDPAGNVVAVVNPRGKTTTLVHDPADKCLSRQVASGLLTTHTYDPAGWLSEVRNVKPTGALQNLFTYTYDRVGNRTTETALDGAVTSWTYDRSFQLTGERRGGATGFDVVYAYDAAGNRTVETDQTTGRITTSVYDGANQLLVGDGFYGRTTYTYDPAGNRTRKETASELVEYDWSEPGHMIAAHPSAGDVAFRYNAVGQRVAKETPDEMRKFLYDFQHLHEESDAEDDPLREYTFGGDNTKSGWGDLVSEYDYEHDETYDHTYDAEWCTDALLDEDLNEVARYRYRAFGLSNLQQWQNPSQPGPAETRMSFVGKQGYYRDEELGLYMLGAANATFGGRQYDPLTGQFLSRDPARDDLNDYRYAENNPVNKIDPSGNACGNSWFRSDQRGDNVPVYWPPQSLDVQAYTAPKHTTCKPCEPCNLSFFNSINYNQECERALIGNIASFKNDGSDTVSTTAKGAVIELPLSQVLGGAPPDGRVMPWGDRRRSSSEVIDARSSQFEVSCWFAKQKGLECDQLTNPTCVFYTTLFNLPSDYCNVLADVAGSVGEVINRFVQQRLEAIVKTLVDGGKQGLHDYVTNIWENLKTAVENWLGIPGLFSMLTGSFENAMDKLLGVLGLNFEGILNEVEIALGPDLYNLFTAVLEQALDAASDPAGWIAKKLQELADLIDSLPELIGRFLGAAKDWALNEVMWFGINAALKVLAPYLGPIYDAITFFRNNWSTFGKILDTLKDVWSIAIGGVDVGAVAARTVTLLNLAVASLLNAFAALAQFNPAKAINSIVTKAKDFIWTPVRQIMEAIAGKLRQAYANISARIGGGDPLGNTAEWSGGSLWYDKKKNGLYVMEGGVLGVGGKVSTLSTLGDWQRAEVRTQAGVVESKAKEAIRLIGSKDKASIEQGLALKKGAYQTELKKLADMLGGDDDCESEEAGNEGMSTASRATPSSAMTAATPAAGCCIPRVAKSASSTRLGSNLESGTGGAADVPPNTVSNEPEAHHIVSGNAAGAAISKSILTSPPICIGINDAVNGVWLPKTSGVTVAPSTNPLGRVTHNRTFESNYQLYVSRQITAARTNKAAVQSVLTKIRGELASGVVNW